MLEHFPTLHDSDNGRLEEHLPVLVHGLVSLLHLGRSVALDVVGDPELGSLVHVLQVQADHGVGFEFLRGKQKRY